MYLPSDVAKMRDDLGSLADRRDQLIIKFYQLQLSSSKADEYCKHGFLRRLKLMHHLAKRVFSTIPPDAQTVQDEAMEDATAFLHAFFINIFGALDNLARVWVYEAETTHKGGKTLHDSKFGLGPGDKYKLVRSSLPQSLQDYLHNAKPWFDYLESYRHSLAHRIPLYIPPKQLNQTEAARWRKLEVSFFEAMSELKPKIARRYMAEMSSIGLFKPVMLHSYSDASTNEAAQPMMFHGQIICDLLTIHEIADQILYALKDFIIPRST